MIIRNRKLDDHRAAVEFCLKSFKVWFLIIVLMIVCICYDKVLVYTVLCGKMKQERWPQGLWNLLAVSKKSDHDAYWEITSFNTHPVCWQHFLCFTSSTHVLLDTVPHYALTLHTFLICVTWRTQVEDMRFIFVFFWLTWSTSINSDRPVVTSSLVHATTNMVTIK